MRPMTCLRALSPKLCARTSLAKVDHLAAQQDHEAVEQAEAEGRRAVDGAADGDAVLRQQILHHQHHLSHARAARQ